MTLDKDRKKNLRPPMRRGVFIAWMVAVVAVFVFIGVILVVSGQSLF